jgi:dTDP-glucose 4,6-dehydratase
MQNILVTGGAGFIGSNFVRYLLRHQPGLKVVNLDALTYAGSLENLTGLPNQDNHHFIQGDICDRELVDEIMADQDIDTIVHFAAETHVDRSILGPEQFIRTNITGTFTLLEAARKINAGRGSLQDVFRFHHISTDEVYGTLEPDDPPFTEKTSYSPNSPYSASKAASDHLVRAYWKTYALPVTITNCSNNYGPYQFPEKFIPHILLNALNGKPLPIYGDGLQIRDWLFVEDHCQAIYRVLEKGQEGETYNIGGNNQPTNLTIVETLCEILDELMPSSAHTPHNALISFVSDRPGHDRRYAVDISKIKEKLNWEPAHSLKDGLLKTAQWYLNHPAWIEAIAGDGDFQNWVELNYQKR